MIGVIRLDIYIPVLLTQFATSSRIFPADNLYCSIEIMLHRNSMHVVLMELIKCHVRVCVLILNQDEVVCIQILNM